MYKEKVNEVFKEDSEMEIVSENPLDKLDCNKLFNLKFHKKF